MTPSGLTPEALTICFVVTLESVSMAIGPAFNLMAASLSSRSLTLVAHSAGTASLSKPASIMCVDSLRTTTSTSLRGVASRTAITAAASGISPPSTGQVRSGFAAVKRAPRRSACQHKAGLRQLLEKGHLVNGKYSRVRRILCKARGKDLRRGSLGDIAWHLFHRIQPQLADHEGQS